MSPRTLLIPLFALVWISAVLVAGCTAPVMKPQATPAPTPVLTPAPQGGEKNVFTQADNGGTFPVSPGAVVQLRLAENPTTGYRWNLSVTPGLAILNDSYVPDDLTGTLVGSGGTRVWFLEAMQEGTQVVTGNYERSWEAPAGGAPGFTLTLEVSAGTCGANTCTLSTTTAAVFPRYHVYTEADSGKTVQEPLGETFGIRLQTNPSTGYSWNLSLTPGLSLQRTEYIPSPTAARVGVGGVQAYTIVTTVKGSQVVRAEYYQPWLSTGTVVHQDLEGGFYGILGDDGQNYDPRDLDPKYQVDGLRVAFHATAASGTMTTHQWGTPVSLDAISEIQQFSLNVTVH